MRGPSLRAMSDTLSEHIFDILNYQDTGWVYNLETVDQATLARAGSDVPLLALACQVGPGYAGDMAIDTIE